MLSHSRRCSLTLKAKAEISQLRTSTQKALYEPSEKTATKKPVCTCVRGKRCNFITNTKVKPQLRHSKQLSASRIVLKPRNYRTGARVNNQTPTNKYGSSSSATLSLPKRKKHRGI